ncbi:hypothetical protein BD770DRAFT_438798 [Pilaira anomala]|nr:hypothetical protein BD770DRAFT_438798 [Pilaira anomala]
MRIDSWLSTLYKTQDIPYFERTNNNYELLKNLKKLNFNSTKLVENYVINTVEPDTSFLSNHAITALDSLGSIGYLAGINQTELSNYYTAITHLSIDNVHCKLEQSKLDEIEHSLNDWKDQMNQELIHMKAILSKLLQQQSGLPGRDDNNPEQMIIQNKPHYSMLEKKYAQLYPYISLSDVNALDQESIRLEFEYQTKSELLSSYLGLPNDIDLASIKVQQTEDELHELESKREDLLTDMMVDLI